MKSIEVVLWPEHEKLIAEKMAKWQLELISLLTKSSLKPCGCCMTKSCFMKRSCRSYEEQFKSGLTNWTLAGNRIAQGGSAYAEPEVMAIPQDEEAFLFSCASEGGRK